MSCHVQVGQSPSRGTHLHLTAPNEQAPELTLSLSYLNISSISQQASQTHSWNIFQYLKQAVGVCRGVLLSSTLPKATVPMEVIRIGVELHDDQKAGPMQRTSFPPSLKPASSFTLMAPRSTTAIRTNLALMLISRNVSFQKKKKRAETHPPPRGKPKQKQVQKDQIKHYKN